MIGGVPKWFAVLYWMLEKVDAVSTAVSSWAMLRFTLRDRYCSCDQCKKRKTR